MGSDGSTAKRLKHNIAETPIDSNQEVEKAYEDMTWPERAADAALKAEVQARSNGASEQEAQLAAQDAGEAVMRRATQMGYQEPPKKKRFDASKAPKQPSQQEWGPKLSVVEQVRASGMPASARGGGNRGGGAFGLGAPRGEAGLY